jgi:hypothetical protein
MAAALKAEGIPTSVAVDTTAAPGENDASLDGFLVGGPLSLLGIQYQQVLAGHQSPYLRQDATEAVAWLISGNRIVGLQDAIQVGAKQIPVS